MRILLLLLLYPFALCAQPVIQGQVSGSDKQPVPFAQVILKSLPDSTIIKIDIADSAGHFNIATSSPRIMLLQATAAGFVPGYVTITDTVSPAINVPVTLKLRSNELGGVTVTASKPLLERRADRTIFNVGSSVSAIGSDVYELLKKAPGVRVSENDGISLAGKSTVSVMIDNKLQQLGATELTAMLRSMSAENVDKIEVITTPPARYDAQGNSGIINIVTKKNAKNGFNGSVNIGYQQRTRGSQKFGESLNYRRGKVNIYSTGNTNNFDFQSRQKTKVSYGNQLQAQVLDQRNRPFYNRYQLGADFNITPKAVIGALYTIGNTSRQTSQLYKAPVISIADGSLDSTQHTVADEEEKALRHALNLNYEWRIDTTGKKLNIDADHFTRTENDHRDFSNQSFLPDGAPAALPAYNRTTAHQKIDISSMKADIILPYKWAELSLGGKISSINTFSNNRFSYIVSGIAIPDTSRTNLFDYTENTQAAYISAAKKHNKWEAQLGLRTENTQTTAISRLTAQTVKNNYIQFFPTAYLQYAASEAHVFNINYSRRVGRPSFEELNPFRVYGSGNSYRTGNPFLQPSFYHTAELSYNLKSKYTFTIYGSIVNNVHARVSLIDTVNNTFYFTNVNTGSAYNTGASAMLTFNPFSWWESIMQLQGYYDVISSGYYNTNPSVNGIMAFQVQTNNSFILNKQKALLAEAGFNYTSRFQYDFIIHGDYAVLSAGIKALFFDKQLTLGINGTDLLRTEIYSFTNIYNDVQEESYFDARGINISLNWKFGSKQIKAKRQRETETEEARRSQ